MRTRVGIAAGLQPGAVMRARLCQVERRTMTETDKSRDNRSRRTSMADRFLREVSDMHQLRQDIRSLCR
jgi:hypothetical protein